VCITTVSELSPTASDDFPFPFLSVSGANDSLKHQSRERGRISGFTFAVLFFLLFSFFFGFFAFPRSFSLLSADFFHAKPFFCTLVPCLT